MKAFLMYPDRDFDMEQPLPSAAEALTQDLGLPIVLAAMAGGDAFLKEVATKAILGSTDDVDTIRYRQAILRDGLANPKVVRALYNLAGDAIQREKKGFWGGLSRHPGYMLHRSVEVLEMFTEMLRKLRGVAERSTGDFESVGFKRFFTMLITELSDEYFGEIGDHLRRLRFRGGVLESATLGRGLRGLEYCLRKPKDDQPGWFDWILGRGPASFTYRVHERNEAGARALSELRDRGINLVANALARSTDHILSFFTLMRTELAFYVGCLNLADALAAKGQPFCFPAPFPVGGRELSVEGLYDTALALSADRKVIGNTANADGKDIVVITGANQGGKSTFLRSLGLAQLMMQCGMFVSASRYAAAASSGLFSHFKREEDATMTSGKFDEELDRMSRIADRIRPEGTILFNESFAATNEREGSEIARQIVHALVESRIRVAFVTHMYDFAHGFEEENRGNVLFLRAERSESGERTFRMIEVLPLDTSYGEDLFRKTFGSEELLTDDTKQVSI
ncbi:MAG TPA: DNA mismatch repair protein MutS [Acetobacteraceae bacterium]|nr:DNA mismatch repair protein MutS [Acetobacteraceae bacterium]